MAETALIREHDQVVVIEDLRELPVRAGEMGTVVYTYPSRKFYEVEFVNLAGASIGVATLEDCEIRPVRKVEIEHTILLTTSP